MTRGLAALVVAAAFALVPVNAFAAVSQPVDLGVGQNPNVTLEADGTADIAYTGQGADSTRLIYCRMPRGATACSVRTEVATPGDSLTKPIAFGSGNNVNLVSYRYGLTNGPFSQVLWFQSSDGGASFGPGQPVGTVPPFDFGFGSNGTVYAVTDAVTAELDFQTWTLGTNNTAKAALDGDPYEYQGQIGLLGPDTPIVVYASRGGDGRFRRYSGVGDLNDANSWAPAVDIGKLGTPHVVSGPNGVILIGQDDLTGPNLEARRFDGTTFGPRKTIDANQSAAHAVEDGGGRVHVVGYSYGGNGRVYYASSYDGVNWISEYVDYPTIPQNMRLAVNPDHYGTMVGTLYGNGHVFAAGIGPAAAEPTPGKFVGASLVSGTVLVQIPPSKQFVALNPGDVIPVGSVVDATNGRVQITIKLPNGKLQSTDFYQGVFKVTQAKKTGAATMVLAGGNFKACGGKGAAVRAAKNTKVVRQLWGNGKGRFATKGRYAAASVRGTTWDTVDRCDGTLIKVTKGKIAVTNLKTNRLVKVLKAGQSFFVKA